MTEIWKPIKGFEGLYEVSSLGRIKSLEKTGSVFTGKGKPRKEYKRPERIIEGWAQEYQMVELRKNGKSYSNLVHRLVAETFVPNPNKKHQVNHIDENKFNNLSENLEWVSLIENVNHGTGIERRSAKQRKSIVAVKNCESFSFASIKEAAKTIGIDPTNISHCLAGRQKTAKGYVFSYSNKHKEVSK